MPARSTDQGSFAAVVSSGMRVLVLSIFALFVPTMASAQPPRRTEQPPPQTSPAGGELEDDEEADTGDASQQDVVEGGRRVRVFRFSGLDIAGRLRSPQLLYFLNRLRAEFDRPRLPHRSFMPELGRSPRSDAF